jgi:hypothetical protein
MAILKVTRHASPATRHPPPDGPLTTVNSRIFRLASLFSRFRSLFDTGLAFASPFAGWPPFETTRGRISGTTRRPDTT